MKITETSKIEYLHSTHKDKGQERVPTPKTTQLRVLSVLFNTIGRVFPVQAARFGYKIFATPRWKALHLRTDAVIDAARVVDFSFGNDTIKCYEWGDEKSERTVLLAHGWESRGTALRMYVTDLVALGFRVVAYDALAHGDSTGQRNNLLVNGRTIVALSAHYGGFYGAIGHSFGCSSIIYALEFLDIKLRIERLVFLAVPHRTIRILEGFFKMVDMPDSVKKVFLIHFEQLTGRKMLEIDVALASKKVQVGQLLLVHDKYDDVTSIDAAERIAEHWDNAHLLVTEGYGHFRIAKNPDVIKRIVAFMA